MKIIEAPRNKPIEVEVTTLSKKPNEKKGKAKVHMWQPNKKKDCTIMVSLHSGSQFIFVKAVMEKFIKIFINALISEPDEDPLSQFRVKTQKANHYFFFGQFQLCLFKNQQIATFMV